MRFEDLQDFWKLRQETHNAWEVVRFRKRSAPGRELRVRFRQEPPLRIRGGYADFHMFHRIFLRDEYRLDAVPAGAWQCVLDLGANVGLFAARAARLAKRVVAYEPFPENFALLEENACGRPEIVCERAAVSDREGMLPLFRPRNPSQSGVYSLHADMGGHMSEVCVPVPTLALDQVFERHGIDHCDLIKIDVEGHEYTILYGASDAVLARTQRIYAEYHDVDAENPRTRVGALRDHLRAHGFVVETVPHRRKPNFGLLFARRG